MENAADALKIAFAIFVFVIAITITFSLVSQAKSTADYILYYTDETNFYENLDSKNTNRTVSIAEVISALYRYSDESFAITIKLKNGNIKTFDLSNSSYNEGVVDYIKDTLLGLPTNTLFTEEFVEVPISGIYSTGTDDSEVVLASGGKKVYITYIEE